MKLQEGKGEYVDLIVNHGVFHLHTTSIQMAIPILPCLGGQKGHKKAYHE